MLFAWHKMIMQGNQGGAWRDNDEPMQVVSIPGLYGNKLCAALDRQHPRDLFDISILLNSHGIDRPIFDGFLAYLLPHNRPISEILSPRWKDIGALYDNEFRGMTIKPVTLDELNNARHQIIDALRAHFTQQDYDFLYSFKSGDPNWALAPHNTFSQLPAIKWKLLNIRNMSAKRKAKYLTKLENVMSEWLGD